MITEWTERSPLRERLEKEAARRKAYRKAYYIANKEKVNRKCKEYYAVNRDQLNANNLERQREHKSAKAIYDRIRYQANKKAIRTKHKKYYIENRDWQLAYRKMRRQMYREQIDLQIQEWRKRNTDKVTAYTARSRAKRMKAVPRWLSAKQWDEIETYYATVQAMMNGAFPSVERGIYEVDHIIPLCGENVSGLHVPWNLQILTQDENRDKSNHLLDDEHLICYAAPGYDRVRRKLLGAARRAA